MVSMHAGELIQLTRHSEEGGCGLRHGCDENDKTVAIRHVGTFRAFRAMSRRIARLPLPPAVRVGVLVDGTLSSAQTLDVFARPSNKKYTTCKVGCHSACRCCCHHHRARAFLRIF